MLLHNGSLVMFCSIFGSKHENSRNFTDKLRSKNYFLENRKDLGDNFNTLTQKITDISHWVRK